jgi:hypothetical protein
VTAACLLSVPPIVIVAIRVCCVRDVGDDVLEIQYAVKR